MRMTDELITAEIMEFYGKGGIPGVTIASCEALCEATAQLDMRTPTPSAVLSPSSAPRPSRTLTRRDGATCSRAPARARSRTLASSSTRARSSRSASAPPRRRGSTVRQRHRTPHPTLRLTTHPLTLCQIRSAWASQHARRRAAAHARRRGGHGRAGARHELPGARRGRAAAAAHDRRGDVNARVCKATRRHRLLGAQPLDRGGRRAHALAHRGREHAHLPQGREPVHPDLLGPRPARAHVRAPQAVRLQAGLGPAHGGRRRGAAAAAGRARRRTSTTPCGRRRRRPASSAPRSRSTCARRSGRASWPSARAGSRACSTARSAWPSPRAWASTSRSPATAWSRPFARRICWHSCNGESHAGGQARPKPARAHRPLLHPSAHPLSPQDDGFTSARARAARRTRASTSCCGAVCAPGPMAPHQRLRSPPHAPCRAQGVPARGPRAIQNHYDSKCALTPPSPPRPPRAAAAAHGRVRALRAEPAAAAAAARALLPGARARRREGLRPRLRDRLVRHVPRHRRRLRRAARHGQRAAPLVRAVRGHGHRGGLLPGARK